MIFFYEILFVAVCLVSIVLGETWSRVATVVFLLGWLAVIALGYASFGARLAATEMPLAEEDRLWYADARAGLRHLRLLFAIATGVAVVWLLLPR